MFLEKILSTLELYAKNSTMGKTNNIDAISMLLIWLHIVIKNPLSFEALDGIGSQCSKLNRVKLQSRMISCLETFRSTSTSIYEQVFTLPIYLIIKIFNLENYCKTLSPYFYQG